MNPDARPEALGRLEDRIINQPAVGIHKGTGNLKRVYVHCL